MRREGPSPWPAVDTRFQVVEPRRISGCQRIDRPDERDSVAEAVVDVWSDTVIEFRRVAPVRRPAFISQTRNRNEVKTPLDRFKTHRAFGASGTCDPRRGHPPRPRHES